MIHRRGSLYRWYSLLVLTCIALVSTVDLHAQLAPATAMDTLSVDPQMVVEQWIDRLNGLDDWHLSLEGEEEGIDQVVDSMMGLFASDVFAEVPPPHDEDQIGPVMLRGRAQVRRWVDRLARSQVRLGYLLKRQTMRQFEGERLVYSTPLPWGGVGISFQIIGVYSLREDRRQRFMAPGAVFLELGEDGKIQRLRMYLTEVAQISPL